MSDRDSRCSSSLDAALETLLSRRPDEPWHEVVDILSGAPRGSELGQGKALGDFVLDEILGSGGMGIVFRAHRKSDPGCAVAIKVLHPVLQTSRSRDRFEREIAIVGRLDHPGIVSIVDSGVQGDIPYYAMSRVVPLSLAGLLREVLDDRRVRRPERRMEKIAQRVGLDPPTEAETGIEGYVAWVVSVGLAVARALGAAHEQGVIHRDIKPGNVLIDGSGPLLSDFGLACTSGPSRLTASGEFVGTLEYASPEQVSGSSADRRSDVYSLGATIYETLTLRKPFLASSREKLIRMIGEGVLQPFEAWIPGELQRICRTALRVDPGERYSSCAPLIRELEAFSR